MQIQIQDGPCPCASGKHASECCFKRGRLRHPPPPCNTEPPSPRTGYAHPKCYASGLADCCRDISGEHYISRNLLEILAGDQKIIKVSGFPWALAEKSLRPKTLESRILCARHNSALSGLDALAGRLFDFLLSATTAIHNWPSGPVALFNGHDLERWMLKVLCGVVASGNAMSGDLRLQPAINPPIHWLQTLFYNQRLPPQCGLYFLNATVGTRDPLVHGFSHAPLSHDGHIYGNIVGLNNMKFCLAMTPGDRLSSGSILKDSLYRVEHLVFKAQSTARTLLLAWKQRGDRQGVEIAVTPMRPT